jgi:hypothetical protein
MNSQRLKHLCVIGEDDHLGPMCDPQREMTIRDNWTHEPKNVTCKDCISLLTERQKKHHVPEAPRIIVRCLECGHRVRNPKPMQKLKVIDPMEKLLFGDRRRAS